MKVIGKIKWRLSRSTYDNVINYIKWINISNPDLKHHLVDYFIPFLFNLILGRFGILYRYLTLYGAKVRKKESNYLKSINLKLSLKDVYKTKNINKTLIEINESKNLNEFEIYGLKFNLIDDQNFQSVFFWELKDLVIPYLYGRHLLYNDSLIGEGTYETDNVFIRDGDVAIDVGSNIGLFTIFSSIKRNASMVYAFEPIKTIIELLDSNIRLNGISDKVKIINKGLGDTEGTFEMSISNENIASSSMVFDRDGNNNESVLITTLDSFIESESIQQINFIKVDIEGAERLFLEGAQGTLAKFQPKLSICTYHLIDDPVVLTELILKANPNYRIEYYSQKLYAW